MKKIYFNALFFIISKLIKVVRASICAKFACIPYKHTIPWLRLIGIDHHYASLLLS